MMKISKCNDKSGEKILKTFLMEKRFEQQCNTQIGRIEKIQNKLLRTFDAQSKILQTELASSSPKTTHIADNFRTDTEDNDDVNRTIWYPLERTSDDWKPRPCRLGSAGFGRKERCVHFPCRTITSYHFIFRELPKFMQDKADESVRRSKQIADGIVHDLVDANEGSISDKGSVVAVPDTMDNKKGFLPDINMIPNRIAWREQRLKLITEKKRRINQLENKPLDRSIRYGAPTSVRQLKKPVRPVVQSMDALNKR